jgi:hypothetical protein
LRRIQKKIKDWKIHLWGPLFLLYYWFLWQLDLVAAHYVWKYGENDYIDGWIFERILGHEFFRVTSFYNFCMLILLIFQIITFTLYNIKGIYRMFKMRMKRKRIERG